jgi:drug/metabolite transporter (DMT)-like permease
MTAIRHSTVVDVTLLGTLAPVVVAIMAVPLFGERPGTDFRAWTAVAIAGAGAVVVAGSTGPTGDSFGMALAVMNVVAFSLFFVLSKVSRDHLDVVPFLFGVMVVAAVFVSVFSLVTGQQVADIGTADLLRASVVAVVPGALGHFVMTWPLRWIPANVPPLVKLDIPLVSGLLAWVVLGQTITPLHVLGGLVTVIGVAGALLSTGGRRLMATGSGGSADAD